MVTIKELVQAGVEVPTWLLEAEVRDEDISLEGNRVIWKSGIWKDGTWLDGVWEDGTWEDGIWEKGVWQYGIWREGLWRNGTWKGGFWENGLWEGGIWESGHWENGIWEGGIWRGGATVIKSKYRPLLQENGTVAVGCKTKTPEEWLDWLGSSSKEYTTPRNTEDFKLIEAHILATLWYKVTLCEDEELKNALLTYYATASE